MKQMNKKGQWVGATISVLLGISLMIFAFYKLSTQESILCVEPISGTAAIIIASLTILLILPVVYLLANVQGVT
jgi:hypothetical protein